MLNSDPKGRSQLILCQTSWTMLRNILWATCLLIRIMLISYTFMLARFVLLHDVIWWKPLNANITLKTLYPFIYTSSMIFKIIFGWKFDCTWHTPKWYSLMFTYLWFISELTFNAQIFHICNLCILSLMTLVVECLHWSHITLAFIKCAIMPTDMTVYTC